MLITFATSNPGKVATARRHLAPFGVRVEQVDIVMTEPQTTHVAAVARSKAGQAWSRLHRPLIVEDGGLCIEGLKGFPGSLTKHLIAALGSEGIAHLADMSSTRIAWFETCLVYVGADGKHTEFPEESPPGTIGLQPMGITPADAWSPLWDVYVPAGHEVPISAMDSAERAEFDTNWAARSRFRMLGDFLVAQGVASAPGPSGQGCSQ